MSHIFVPFFVIFKTKELFGAMIVIGMVVRGVFCLQEKNSLFEIDPEIALMFIITYSR